MAYRSFIEKNILNASESVVFIYQSGSLDKVGVIIVSIIFGISSVGIVLSDGSMFSAGNVKFLICLPVVLPIHMYAYVGYINAIYGICVATTENIYFSNLSTGFKIKKYDINSIRNIREIIQPLSNSVVIYFNDRTHVRLYNVKKIRRASKN